MPTTLGIGFSQHPDPAQAFREAAIAAKSQLKLPSCDLLITFSTPSHLATAEKLMIATKYLNPLASLYASSSALILPHGVENNGVSMLAISSPDISFSTASQATVNLDSLHETGLAFSRSLIKSLTNKKRQALLYLLNHPISNHAHFINGIHEGLGRAFLICGGICSGEETRIGCQSQTMTDSACGLMIAGQTTIGIGVGYGWQPLGRPRLITQAKGNIINTIDHKPALEIYGSYFAEANTLNTTPPLVQIGQLYPLGIRTATPKHYLIRHPMETLNDGSLVVQGDVTTGDAVHIMIADKDVTRQETRNAAIMAREQLKGDHPLLAIVLASAARRKLLGRAAAHEISTIKETLGLTTPVFGMYTDGEIIPPHSAQHIAGIEIQGTSILIMAIGYTHA